MGLESSIEKGFVWEAEMVKELMQLVVVKIPNRDC